MTLDGAWAVLWLACKVWGVLIVGRDTSGHAAQPPPPPPFNQVFTTEGFLHLTMPESLMGSGIATPEVSTARGGGGGDGSFSSPGSKRGSSRSRRGDRERDRGRRRQDAAAGEVIPTAFRDPDHPNDGLRPKVWVVRVCMSSRVCVCVCVFACVCVRATRVSVCPSSASKRAHRLPPREEIRSVSE